MHGMVWFSVQLLLLVTRGERGGGRGVCTHSLLFFYSFFYFSGIIPTAVRTDIQGPPQEEYRKQACPREQINKKQINHLV